MVEVNGPREEIGGQSGKMTDHSSRTGDESSLGAVRNDSDLPQRGPRSPQSSDLARSQSSILHVGAGHRKIKGAVTLDINPRCEPEIAFVIGADLSGAHVTATQVLIFAYDFEFGVELLLNEVAPAEPG